MWPGNLFLSDLIFLSTSRSKINNSSVKISSLALGSRGISEQNWSASAGGESAFLAFNPDNPRYVMGGSYLGTIEILDTEAKASTQIMAAPIQYLGRDSKDMKYRYNWNAPIIWSQHEKNTFYHGAQLLLKTTDNGKNWTEISPDLSNNEKEKQGKNVKEREKNVASLISKKLNIFKYIFILVFK